MNNSVSFSRVAFISRTSEAPIAQLLIEDRKMAGDTQKGEGPRPPARTSTPFFPAFTTFLSLFL